MQMEGRDGEGLLHYAFEFVSVHMLNVSMSSQASTQTLDPQGLVRATFRLNLS